MGLFSFFSKKNKDENQNEEIISEKVEQIETSSEEVKESADAAISKEEPVKAEISNEQPEIESEASENTESAQKQLHTTEAVKEEAVQTVSEETGEKKAETISEVSDEKADNKTETDMQRSDETENASEKTEETKVKRSFFERLKRTRENLALGIGALVSGKKIDEDLYEELETALLTADLGVETTNRIIEKLREESKLRELKDASALKNNLKNILKDILKPCAIPLDVKRTNDLPFVILMVGVNGAGKTTTIGKLALKYKEQGKSVMLAAGDTFRAAAVEQLKEWGTRTNTPVVSQPTGSDSASVIYDALTSAKAHNTDVLICDTAGRLQNKDNLMEELKKIVRVMKKIDENVPNEVMLVLDSTTGQNAVSQMKIFGEAVNVSGLALTKLDGTAKGGVIFALADKFKVPVRYVGIGESKEDLRVFDVDHFVDALFS
ncbi:signal recognition particle-docking protein FtsY [Succinivibrio dextrinosolvens DSM 3072]|uniref:Signal recognition particle receptor FtsY n=1 Tax=Succinivibrio dextrinosolvens DSM 3072 TaxID=1123324 RepID=A0A1T4V2Y5_9GAMM|nr:signal recognition particle-docking protein FtsY [Succinivibrio dextrinosolvens]SKA59315.1 signal recognition particle-docking protein FtsY [Succinivibrio dextrinosolvens DSM 3072]